MRATAEIQVIPLGVGVSVRSEVERAYEVLNAAGLTTRPHATGTNVEGDVEEILRAVSRIHERLHGEGVVRIITNLKLDTRTDKEQTLDEKQLQS